MSEAEVTPLLTPAGGVPKLIETDSELAAAISKLATLTGPIAVDAERASGYRYSARVYLIQIKRGDQIFLIDPIPFAQTPDNPLIAELNKIIESEEGILHAATQDLPCLGEFG